MQKRNSNENFKSLKGFILGFIFAVALITGTVYAWNAVWHGTNWIGAGNIIETQKIAENFEFLKREIESLRNEMNIINVQLNNIKGTVVAGCRLNAGSYYGDNCWGGARSNNRDWRYRSVTCPSGTKKFVTSISSRTSYYDGGDGGSYGAGSGGWSETYSAETAICIKQ